MGSVTDLIYNVRSDIERHCPPATLAHYDAAMDDICRRESQAWNECSIAPLRSNMRLGTLGINRNFWSRPSLVFEAFSWFFSGAIVMIVVAVLLAILKTQ